jgi:hypothetical protein
VGSQVGIILAYGAMYRHRVAPLDGSACDLPFDLCSQASVRGWAARFYVGAPPNALSQADSR